MATEVVPITALFSTVWLKGTVVTLFWKEHQKPTRFCMPEAESKAGYRHDAVTSIRGRD